MIKVCVCTVYKVETQSGVGSFWCAHSGSGIVGFALMFWCHCENDTGRGVTESPRVDAPSTVTVHRSPTVQTPNNFLIITHSASSLRMDPEHAHDARQHRAHDRAPSCAVVPQHAQARTEELPAPCV